ncbi:keratin 98 [Pholidichthys leucotaenia]
MSYSYHNKRTQSVCGGAGGFGTRISSSSAQKSYGSSSGTLNLTDGLDLHVGTNEKATMQNLNDRLAAYLEKVRSLEKENERLEKHIGDWYSSRPMVTHDHSAYLATIEDLQKRIHIASMTNTKIILCIDNAKLATDDFKVRYDNELSMRMAVEADIAGLRKLLDDLNLARIDLESHCESLKDELAALKRNHKEDLAAVRTQMGGQVNVEVDAGPSIDLNQTISEIREHYEGLISKNCKDLELWYEGKRKALEKEMVSQTETLATSCTEIKDLKSTLQRLQIELQSQQSMKASLDGTLAETQACYAAQLANLQSMVTSLEAQLSQIHANIISTKQEYDMLLDLKTRLELEIVEYRRLLDGEDDSSKQVITKVITVVETVVDGKVVQSSKTVDVDVDEIEA